MVSVLITSWKEPNTIAKAIRCIADSKYSGIPKDFQVIQVSPDKETLDAGLKEAKRLKLGNKFLQIKDPLKGKPFALNMAFKQVKGEICILTDGDVFFAKNAVKNLLVPFENSNVFGVGGRPKSSDSRNNMMGYWGHLLADAADYRRRNVMEKKKNYYISGKSFFPMSGYIHAVRKKALKTHPGSLSEDAYLSYQIRNSGHEISYAPNAVAYVKYPQTVKDYVLQKSRSLGGYMHLKKLGVTKRDGQSRSFLLEAQHSVYALFIHPKNIKETWWALLMHPVRIYLWLVILWKRVVLKQGMPKRGWERIESTK